jgi:hypothetical protein
MMNQLFKTELQEHRKTFETIEMQEIRDSVDTVCIKECQSNIHRTSSK